MQQIHNPQGTRTWPVLKPFRRARSPAVTSSNPTISSQPSQTVPLPPSQVDEIFERVRANLTPDELAILKRYLPTGVVGVDVAVDAVLVSANDAQKLCTEKRSQKWTYQWRGKTVTFEDTAKSIVFMLDRFKFVGDGLSNIDPVHIGVPWAGVRLLLEVSETNSMA